MNTPTAEWQENEGEVRLIGLMEARYLRDYYRWETESLLSSHLRPILDRAERDGGAHQLDHERVRRDFDEYSVFVSYWMCFEKLCRIVVKLERAEVAILTGRQLEAVS